MTHVGWASIARPCLDYRVYRILHIHMKEVMR